MQIVDFLYNLAREHKRINGFRYGRAYEKGAGNAAYPLMWLDDPILGNSAGDTVRYSVNVDVLGIPDSNKDADVLQVQTDAYTAGLSTIERIKVIRPLSRFSIDGFSFITLRDYYDDGAAGVRFTMTIIQANPVDRCAEDFDPTKQFPTVKTLPEFLVDNPDGCAIFNNGTGLPNFKTS